MEVGPIAAGRRERGRVAWPWWWLRPGPGPRSARMRAAAARWGPSSGDRPASCRPRSLGRRICPHRAGRHSRLRWRCRPVGSATSGGHGAPPSVLGPSPMQTTASPEKNRSREIGDISRQHDSSATPRSAPSRVPTVRLDRSGAMTPHVTGRRTRSERRAAPYRGDGGRRCGPSDRPPPCEPDTGKGDPYERTPESHWRLGGWSGAAERAAGARRSRLPLPHDCEKKNHSKYLSRGWQQVATFG